MDTRTVITPKGEVRLISDMDFDLLSSLKMGNGLGIFFHYRYEEAKRTKEVLSLICRREGFRVAGAVSEDSLIGYLTIVPPEKGSRWESVNASLVRSADILPDPVLLEVGSIEISTSWRSLGLARKLLQFTFENEGFGSRIVFTRELSWHWDLKSSGLSAYRYRSILLRLFEGAGFRYCVTDDEEVSYSGENMFMARVGRSIPPETALLFHRSICRSEPKGWGWG